MDTMLTWARSAGKGIPVHIGEWGVGWGSRYTTFKKTTVLVEPLPFQDLRPATRKDFDAAFARYASYLGLDCDVRWSR
jgi:hypothetical protein